MVEATNGVGGPQPERSDSAEEQKTRPAAQVDDMRSATKTLSESNMGPTYHADSATGPMKRGQFQSTTSSSLPESVQTRNNSELAANDQAASRLILEENKRGSSGGDGVPYGGMTKHQDQRIDRLGKQIKSKRERQPNGQKKRLQHKITFCDQLQNEDVRKPLEQVILVESYKKYNVDTTHNDQGCCTIF